MKKLITIAFIFLFTVSKSQKLSLDSLSKITGQEVLGYQTTIYKDDNGYKKYFIFFYKQRDFLVYDYLGGVKSFNEGKLFLDSLSKSKSLNITAYRETELKTSEFNFVRKDEMIFYNKGGKDVYDIIYKNYSDEDLIIAKFRDK